MPDVIEFWEDGSLPPPSELRRYLETLGISEEDIGSVVRAYEVEILGRSEQQTFTRESVNEWLNSRIGLPQMRPARPGDPTPPDVPGSVGPRPLPTEPTPPRPPRVEPDGENPDLAGQVAQRTAGQVASFNDEMNRRRDAGAALANELGASVALGVRTDEYGNPIVDPETGQPMGVDPAQLWAEISGLRFNMGSLTVPHAQRGEPGYTPAERFTGLVGQRATRGGYAHRGMSAMEARAAARQDARPHGRAFAGGVRDIKRQFIRPAQLMAILNNLDEDYLTQLQMEMYEAGLYGEEGMPSWGVADTATRQALVNAFINTSLEPNATVSEVLNRLASERITRRGQGELEGEGGIGEQALPSFKPEVTSAETLRQQIDQIAQALMGRFAPEDKRESIVQQLQAGELEYQRSVYERQVADVRAQNEQAAMGPGGEDIDAFMEAISGKESGGDYDVTNPDSGAYGRFQIMPSNWAPWAERAGLGPNAPRTPENQDIVARRIMLDYFEEFGNWRDVAVAWYAGPGRVRQVRNSRVPQGRYPSIASYADDIMQRFAQLRGLPSEARGAGAMGAQYDPIEVFDPAAEAEAILKAQDPIGWEGHEFANRAEEFFGLLGGVV